jgi:outer membrane protein W
MKKYAFFFLLPLMFFSLVSSSLKAFDFGCMDFSPCVDASYDASFRVAGYIPLNKRVKKIYSNTWSDFQLEFNKNICQNLSVWINGQYTANNGESYGYSEAPTKIRLIPVSIGLKYNYEIVPCLNIYLGAGAAYSWLYIRDDYEYVHEHTHKQAWGGLFKLGFQYNISECFFAEVFSDYLLQRFKFSGSDSSPYVERRDANMDAVIVGAGVGIHF